MKFKVYSIVLKLVRKALDSSWQIDLPEETDWQEALNLAIAQGVLGLCFEAVEKLPVEAREGLQVTLDSFRA